VNCSVAATLKQAPLGQNRVKTARRTPLRKTPWRKTRVKTRARAPVEARARRPGILSDAAIKRTVNSEVWMLANDAAGEAKAANPVLTAQAAENGAHGETEAINPGPNGRTANRERRAAASDAVGEAAATAVLTARAAASDAVGEAEATAVLTARAAENSEHGETEAIKQTANRGRLTALGEHGRAEAPPALARRAAPSGVTRRAEALSSAPRNRQRRSRK